MLIGQGDSNDFLIQLFSLFQQVQLKLYKNKVLSAPTFKIHGKIDIINT